MMRGMETDSCDRIFVVDVTGIRGDGRSGHVTDGMCRIEIQVHPRVSMFVGRSPRGGLLSCCIW